MGDKKVLKTLIKAGEGYDHPNEGALVKGKLNKRFRDQIPHSRSKKWLLSHICVLCLCIKVVCIGMLEDGTITERKGSDQEPFEYLCLEGNKKLCILLHFSSLRWPVCRLITVLQIKSLRVWIGQS